MGEGERGGQNSREHNTKDSGRKENTTELENIRPRKWKEEQEKLFERVYVDYRRACCLRELGSVLGKYGGTICILSSLMQQGWAWVYLLTVYTLQVYGVPF